MRTCASWSSRAAAVVLLLCLCVPLRADQRPHVACQQRYEEGVALYEAGRYDEASAAFAAAYGHKPLPRLLINLGQAQRRLGDPAAALRSYEQFLQESPSAGQLADRVRGFMALAREQLAARRLAEREPASPPAAAAVLAQRIEQSLRPPSQALDSSRPAGAVAPRARLSLFRRGQFWATVGAVAVGLAAGVVAGTQQLAQDGTPGPGISGEDKRELMSQGHALSGR